MEQSELQESNTAIKQTDLKLNNTEERIKSKRRKIYQTRKNNHSLEEERKCKIDELENMQLEVDQLTTNVKPEEEDKLHACTYQPPGDKARVVCPRFGNCCRWRVVSDCVRAPENCVTIIPLTRILRKTVDLRKIDKARQVARQQGGKIWEAIKLIHFKPDVLPTIGYAFGSSIIFENGELAKNVMFHRDIKVKTVTLDGDQFVVMIWRVLLRTIRLFKHIYETAIYLP
ncbi:hypothetical protein PsorP6_001278 [Peronosclerospora sorghi]|uniref:Uncharacterized protein n=1 Tax=Peronosclerospora sorghi TaxID=230839 RepID=A0ACC0WW27_9STRA|nr:hypothetical protein PsorP6_001278 [Peronosclerospora sorghi]